MNPAEIQQKFDDLDSYLRKLDQDLGGRITRLGMTIGDVSAKLSIVEEVLNKRAESPPSVKSKPQGPRNKQPGYYEHTFNGQKIVDIRRCLDVSFSPEGT